MKDLIADHVGQPRLADVSRRSWPSSGARPCHRARGRLGGRSRRGVGVCAARAEELGSRKHGASRMTLKMATGGIEDGQDRALTIFAQHGDEKGHLTRGCAKMAIFYCWPSSTARWPTSLDGKNPSRATPNFRRRTGIGFGGGGAFGSRGEALARAGLRGVPVIS